MGKLDYLEALKRALLGLPPELQARTLAWYEQRFVDGAAAGRQEADIARELDDPKKVALTLRANTHMDAFAAQKNPANLVRVLVSVVGLLIFNLFMVIPAAVFGALLATLYACAFALYVGGIAITASGLAGANELVLDGPLREIINDIGNDQVRTSVKIDENGVEVTSDRETGAAGGSAAGSDPEGVAVDGIRIATEMDGDARTTQTALGLSAVLGGIVLFLVSIVVTRYAALGAKRYAQMNMSLLRGS
ncbi:MULTISPECIES: DUF1700 domain-containing protein [unclassified Massilia]|uniref:DUF1700 domain-containing protein n=1 Tax=unclassified Massilia TaxID=2609279 RepID=UPI00177C55D7|nr:MULTISPECIES: DUF1700 domain-containing protein [unclassified Massilia]MBD8531848.1 DUF1700 domain-containing protein [Massilia sp. CFBP 13647]MBD8675293.1 DUF1700 domain-containing protein [Massilia sp. CFBP 13721]